MLRISSSIAILDFKSDIRSDAVSVYKGVLVCWDKHFDSRIINFLNGLFDPIRRQLLACGKVGDGIRLCWSAHVPSGFAKGQIVEVYGERWMICESYGDDPYADSWRASGDHEEAASPLDAEVPWC